MNDLNIFTRLCLYRTSVHHSKQSDSGLFTDKTLIFTLYVNNTVDNVSFSFLPVVSHNSQYAEY